jgi:Transport and Golgi organisation 2
MSFIPPSFLPNDPWLTRTAKITHERLEDEMCTVVVDLAPEDQVPLLLLGLRDEFTGRPWQPPARHWPGSPLIGGRDEQAGGTWLAVHPDLPRVACVLNGRGEFAPPGRRLSRGELPLLGAAEGPQALRKLHDDLGTLARYDPFYLVCADPAAGLLLSWDGRQAGLSELGPATHVLTNAGHMYPPRDAESTPDPKAVRFGPKFAAHRPSGDPAASLREAWGDWLTLAAPTDPSAPADPSVPEPGAIIVRRELPDGRVWGTTSVSLVALAADGRLRYDFQPVPADPATWYPVALS